MIQLTAPLRALALQAIVDALNDALAPAFSVIEIYTATAPTHPADAVPGGATLLATIVLNDPSFAAVTVTGFAVTSALIGPVAPVDAVATGTASWFRLVDGFGVPTVTGSVGVASTADLVLNTPSFVLDIPVTLTAFTLRLPESC